MYFPDLVTQLVPRIGRTQDPSVNGMPYLMSY